MIPPDIIAPELNDYVNLELAKVVRDGGTNMRWKHLWVIFTLPQDVRKYRLRLHGVTVDEPPKWYLAQMFISPDVIMDAALKGRVETLLANLLHSLDTYLDPQCKCVPGPFGSLGAQCEWHQKGCKRVVQYEKVDQ